MATTGYIALFGDFLKDRLNLHSAAREFGWSTRQSSVESTCEAVDARARLVAVLIHAKTLNMPWTDALELVQTAAPEVRAVVCHGMDELDSQPKMTASGAFYTLLMPADPRELRFMFAKLNHSAADPQAVEDRSHFFPMAGAA